MAGSAERNLQAVARMMPVAEKSLQAVARKTQAVEKSSLVERS
jgi:hypothetical protein